LERKGTATTALGYDGQYTDGDTGLIYLRARYYDPSTGQFLNVDPAVEATLSPYTYAQDDPLSKTDPTGKEISERAWKFRHEFLGQLSRIVRWAKRHHIDEELIGLFEDYAHTAYFAELFNLDYDNIADYQAWKSHYRFTLLHVIKALEPLAVNLDAADSPGNLVSVLLKTAASVFHW
jgi:RHS repeat-associated protein